MFLRKLREGLTLNAEDLRTFYNQAKPCAGEEEMDEIICQVCKGLVSDP